MKWKSGGQGQRRGQQSGKVAKLRPEGHAGLTGLQGEQCSRPRALPVQRPRGKLGLKQLGGEGTVRGCGSPQ